jgi:hypothetical protein
VAAMTARRAGVGAAISLALLCAGCTSQAPPPQPTVTDSAPADTSIAGEVVDHLQKENHIPLHPVDTTASDCPRAHCAQAIGTDKFTIMSFSRTGDAQHYAADHGFRQIATIVVDFSPNVPDEDRDQMWAEISRMVD